MVVGSDEPKHRPRVLYLYLAVDYVEKKKVKPNNLIDIIIIH